MLTPWYASNSQILEYLLKESFSVATKSAISIFSGDLLLHIQVIHRGL